MSATAEIQIDRIETIIAHMLCADASPASDGKFKVQNPKRGGLIHEATDACEHVLRFDPMQPRLTYTSQFGNDRLFATNADLLLESVQDLLGNSAAVAMLLPDHMRWMGFRRLMSTPRGVWIGQRGATLYEVHFREIYNSGESRYRRSMAAISRDGKPVPICFIGARGNESNRRESECAVIAASIIEDAHRPHALLATVSDGTAIRLPVSVGEHRDLFALRDAPLTPSGRRKAIIHWVAKHTRAAIDRRVDVRPHWRGVKTMTVDGMRVDLEPNSELVPA